MICTIYNDGGHFIAYEKKRNTLRDSKKDKYRPSDMDLYFKSSYQQALIDGLDFKEQKSFVKQALINEFSDFGEKLDEYVNKQFHRISNNIYSRKKRFKRKGFLNDWNYFVTFTYDSTKHDEYTFRKKLIKTLSNFHSRRGWKYMGVWEFSPEKNRLHFHALLYVPKGEMVGTITEHRDYDTRSHKMRTVHINSFFLKKYGRNDFQPISRGEINRTVNYILKYISKTDTKIVYSRNIPPEIFRDIKLEDVACDFIDYVLKFVLFDDVLVNDKFFKDRIEFVEVSDDIDIEELFG